MARKELSNEVEFEKTKYGVELFRPASDESIRLTNTELENLEESL